MANPTPEHVHRSEKQRPHLKTKGAQRTKGESTAHKDAAIPSGGIPREHVQPVEGARDPDVLEPDDIDIDPEYAGLRSGRLDDKVR